CVYGSASSAPEDVDGLGARGEGDDGALDGRAGGPGARRAVALALALAIDRAHLLDLGREELLDCFADLDLVGIMRDDERVDVAVERFVRLLRHDRLDDDVAGIFHDVSPSPSAVSLAAGALAAG